MQALAASASAILITHRHQLRSVFFVIAKKIVPAESLQFLSTPRGSRWPCPCTFSPTSSTSLSRRALPDGGTLPLFWVVFAVVTLGLSLVLGRLFKPGIRREATASLYIYNPVFVPLAVIIGVFGSESPYIADLFLFTAFAATFFFNFYKFFFRHKGKKRAAGQNAARLEKDIQSAHTHHTARAYHQADRCEPIYTGIFN